jgi:hypothetical protein
VSDLAGNRLKTIKSWDEVPEFQNEHEEHEFWGVSQPLRGTAGDVRAALGEEQSAAATGADHNETA